MIIIELIEPVTTYGGGIKIKIIKPANNTTKNGEGVSPNIVICDPFSDDDEQGCPILSCSGKWGFINGCNCF